MPVRDRAFAFTLLAITSLALALLGSTEALLAFAPVLLVVLPLTLGRYPGENVLAAARERLSSATPESRPSAEPQPQPVFASLRLPRGGLLIAASLAKRPPPHRLSLSH